MNKSKNIILIAVIIALAILVGVVVAVSYPFNSPTPQTPVNSTEIQEESTAQNTEEESIQDVDGIFEINNQTAPMNSGGTREQGIKDGALFGYIKSITKNNDEVISISFDVAEFINDDTQPNGYRISNANSALRTYELESSATILVIDMSNPDIGVGIRYLDPHSEYEKFQNYISTKTHYAPPFWLKASGNVIDVLEEQYLP